MPPRSPSAGIPPAEASPVVAQLDVATMPYEAAMRELEGIVARLEQGQVDLEESIAIYERGEALKSRCDALLKSAEVRIEKITLARDGKPVGSSPLDDAV